MVYVVSFAETTIYGILTPPAVRPAPGASVILLPATISKVPFAVWVGIPVTSLLSLTCVMIVAVPVAAAKLTDVAVEVF
jgi:hypothetical protein